MAKAGIQQQYGLFINGEFVPASDGAAFDAHNPANGNISHISQKQPRKT